jgi:hypothetical protein
MRRVPGISEEERAEDASGHASSASVLQKNPTSSLN